MRIEDLAAYEIISRQKIHDLRSEGYLLRHKKSGARIALLSNEDENKVFYIGFKTPPADSTGVAHILEHSVLEGSKEFPVKDPFIELVKGSMNTFLNAMTYPDKTMYPVASCNDKDFANLMHVYMDAVFYPNIYQNDKTFRQEGWSYKLDNPDGELTISGVVYNEMKGAFSSADDVLERETFNTLFPDTPYGVESGGDPSCIPNLTHENFLNFHQTYYHPSNSYIYLYGNMDMVERLNWMDEHYLSHFEKIDVEANISLQEPFAAPREAVKPYSITESEPLEHNTYLTCSMTAGDVLNREEYIAFQILDYALCSSQGAPLKQALLDAGIGEDIYSDYDNGTRQPYFSIVAKNADASRKEEFLRIIDETLEKLVAEGVTDTTATVNPIMFVASTAFILGLGLFLIRIYPYIIRLLARIGRRVWSPAQYVSLTNIGRSSTGRERFLMLFLVLTVSLGVFFANTARALNRNAEESVAYGVGCDAVLTEQWYSSKIESAQQTTPQSASQAAQSGTKQTSEESDEEDTETTIQYVEPVFERFEKLAGVENVTKVFRKDDVTISSNKMNVPRQQTKSDDEEKTRDDFLDQSVDTSSGKSSTSNVQLMTIVPSDFSKVCKFEDRLLPVQLNNYLNALAEYTPGVILSSSFKSYGLELGDTVECKWGGNEPFEVTVLAFVDYWPGLSPYKEAKNGGYMDFAVMNYDYVNVQTSMEPYEVWFKLKDGASVQEFYDSIDKAGIKPLTLESASQQTIEKKNDPMLQGMNGALTLGFIIIMVMCIIGFLIYWILSIKSRTLQFGILRAMGMKFREIIMMIVYEQLLVSGVAIFAAIFIGGVTSDLFVPLFQSIFDASQSVPPFAVIPERSDYLKLYAVIGVMLLTAFVVLGRLIKKIKISQALKLGED